MRQRDDKCNQESQHTQSTNEELPVNVAVLKYSQESFEDRSDREFAAADEALDSRAEQFVDDEVSMPHEPQVPPMSTVDARPLWHSSTHAIAENVCGSPAPPRQPVCPPTTQAPATLPGSVTPASSITATFVSSNSSAMRRKKKMTNRQLAYEAAIGTHLTWADYGGLTSTRTRDEYDEMEL
jgi:hypothetical protein